MAIGGAFLVMVLLIEGCTGGFEVVRDNFSGTAFPLDAVLVACQGIGKTTGEAVDDGGSDIADGGDEASLGRVIGDCDQALGAFIDTGLAFGNSQFLFAVVGVAGGGGGFADAVALSDPKALIDCDFGYRGAGRWDAELAKPIAGRLDADSEFLGTGSGIGPDRGALGRFQGFLSRFQEGLAWFLSFGLDLGELVGEVFGEVGDGVWFFCLGGGGDEGPFKFVESLPGLGAFAEVG